MKNLFYLLPLLFTPFFFVNAEFFFVNAEDDSYEFVYNEDMKASYNEDTKALEFPSVGVRKKKKKKK